MADSRDSKLATPKKSHSSQGKSTLGRAITNVKSYFKRDDTNPMPKQDEIEEISTPKLISHNPPDQQVKIKIFLGSLLEFFVFVNLT